ncbi:hypothetical protein GCM10027049_16300 [Mucilaginibacter puniceus]
MKNIIKIIGAILISMLCLSVQAQTTKTDKKAAEKAHIKNLVESKRYVFVANYIMPLRGGGFGTSSYYDMKVTKDTISTFLPYFGQASMSNYGSIDNGIHFTSTKFTYKSIIKKNGNWEIVIVPLDKNRGNDPLGVRNMILNISGDGYATLQVNNLNRDAISFNGRIQEIPKSDKL